MKALASAPDSTYVRISKSASVAVIVPTDSVFSLSENSFTEVITGAESFRLTILTVIAVLVSLVPSLTTTVAE